VSRARILALSLVAAITFGSGALAQGGGEAAAVPAVERAAQVALLEGAAQVALLGRVAHTALLERAARPEQATRTALLVFSPPAAQAKTLSTPRVRALARAPIQAPSTNKFSSEAGASSSCAAGANIWDRSKRPIASELRRWPSSSST
jgi:hypothetical protein